MILFFKSPSKSVIATESDHRPNDEEIRKLCWLYGGAELAEGESLAGFFKGLLKYPSLHLQFHL